MASSYTSLGKITLQTSGDLKKSVECHEKALKTALDNGYVETAIRAYDNLGSALPWEEQERALDSFEKGFELAKKIGAIRWVSWIGDILSGLYDGMGNTVKGLSLAEESVALDRKTCNLPNLPFSLMRLGSVYLEMGELDKGEQYLTEALDVSKKLNQFQQIAYSSANLGYLYGEEKGDFSKAKECLEKAVEICEKGGDKLSQMYSIVWLAKIYVELGKLQEAGDLLDKVRRFGVETENIQLVAMPDAVIGMQKRAMHKWEESIEHFEKSLREYESMEAKRWLIYHFARFFLWEYARVYLERDQEGDREKAHNLLNQALEIFQKVGAKKDIERVIAKKKLLTA